MKDATPSPPRIGFVVWPEKGHIYPTMHLARILQERGVQIYYFGKEIGRSIVSEQGWSYEQLGPEPEMISALENQSDHEARASIELLIANFSRRLREIGITELFVDPLCHQAAIAALLVGVRVKYVWVFNPPYCRTAYAPFGSSLVLYRNPVARVAPRLLWAPVIIALRYYAVRSRFMKQSLFRVINNLLREYSARFNRPMVLTSYGYRLDLPSVVCGPEVLRPCLDSNVSYLGLGVDSRRAEQSVTVAGDRPLIYCSFGGNFPRYKRALQTMLHVTATAGQMPDFHFIVQVPPEFIEKLPACHPNLSVLSTVPTLALLKRAKAAVIHGGYGSIKECIYFGVPMVILPFAFDQPANTALLIRHGAAIGLSPSRANPDRLSAALRHVIHDSEIGKAIAHLRTQSLAQADCDLHFSESIAGTVPLIAEDGSAPRQSVV